MVRKSLETLEKSVPILYYITVFDVLKSVHECQMTVIMIFTAISMTFHSNQRGFETSGTIR